MTPNWYDQFDKNEYQRTPEPDDTGAAAFWYDQYTNAMWCVNVLKSDRKRLKGIIIRLELALAATVVVSGTAITYLCLTR